jgi:hypothetical protein
MMIEYRVWCENGDLLGYAEVNGDHFAVADADPDSGYAWFAAEGGTTFASGYMAQSYARDWGEAYAAYWRDRCDCETSDCGVMNPHGIYIQVCEDDWDVTGDPCRP